MFNYSYVFILHYYTFSRYFIYNNFFLKLKKLENIICLTLNDYYKYYIYFKFYFFRIYIFFLFFYVLFFKKGDLYLLLKILPYYSLYYFILNIYNFILYNLKYDFDISLMEHYYEKLFFFYENDNDKKKKYINFLLFNYSEYKFKDFFNFKYLEFFEKNLPILDLEIYITTFNKKPKDFYTRIFKMNPSLRVY